jgi:nucleotide-binding universal stress UspA family protein
MRKILVPCDFSEPAINAFRFALDVASQSKGTVYLLNIVELPVIHDSIIMPVITFEQEFLKELKEKALSEFNKIITEYNLEGVEIKPHVESGSPARMITDFAAKDSIDIIIIGSHGASGLREYFVGSNAEKIVRHSSVPVMVMKTYYKGAIKNIVFPNALETEEQEDLIMKVKELQAFFQATVHIVYINTPTHFTSDNITLERLKQFANRFMFENYTINVYNYPYEEKGIIHFTKSIKGNLIAMGTHGRKGISHFISGSLAEDVVNHADCPIWTYALKPHRA